MKLPSGKNLFLKPISFLLFVSLCLPFHFVHFFPEVELSIEPTYSMPVPLILHSEKKNKINKQVKKINKQVLFNKPELLHIGMAQVSDIRILSAV